jgi:hypothetical protein
VIITDSNFENKLKESSKLARQAMSEFYANGKITTVCPKCNTYPVITTTPRGERTRVSCECRYIFTEEINL